ncbi:MAG TPA: endonuclease/exonuclease/phosphatase family protein [Mycobacterium sp.]|nr:endonuclease/exonuclease/phosphatase family protein [Mycobacterium sp.]
MGAIDVLAGAAFAIAAIALAARYVPGVNRAVPATAALAPYLAVGAPVAALLFAITRNWVGIVLAVALTIAGIAVRWRWYVGGRADAGVGTRVVSANLRYGRADPDAVVRLAAQHADILAVQELTPEKADQISAAGMDGVLPHRYLRAREGPAGVGIWSRYPLTPGTDYDEFWLGMITARVSIPGLPSDVTVATTHLSAPWPDPIRGWRDDLTRLRATLGEIAGSAPGPVILAGDLNATPDVLEFRRLLRDGYRDAAEQAGAGLTRTHPADIVLPPVFAVDHILLRGGTATSVHTLPVSGSDHRALLADIAFT